MNTPSTAALPKTKNKTFAAWLALLLGPLGVHRCYLHGLGDRLGWLHWLPSALGVWGVLRVQRYGQDDQLAWVLVPALGFTLAACAVTAIYFGLMAPDKWHRIYNLSSPVADLTNVTVTGDSESELAALPKGCFTNWLTMGAVVGALLFGTIALMSSLVFSFQRYFEYQVEEAQKISQPNRAAEAASPSQSKNPVKTNP